MQSGGHEYEQFRGENDVLANVDPTWYYKPGGGPVYDMTVYCLHELTGILGPVKRVTGMSGIGLPVREWKGQRIEVEMDDNTLMLLDFGDTTFGYAFGANCRGAGLPRLAIFGSDGTVSAGGYGRRPAGGAGGGRGGGVTLSSRHVEGGEQQLDLPEMPYRVGPHQDIGEAHGYADLMHLVDCILEDKTPIPSGEHARHVIEVIEKAYQAAKEGCTLEVTTTL
jgi:predicted dehydrogenase